MELTWNITNEPTHDIQRAVRLRKFDADFDNKSIKMYCIVTPSNPTRMVRETEVILTADNSTFVNAQGQDVEPDEEGNKPEGAFGEYDFLMQYLNNPVILGDLFGAYVAKADLKERFN